MQVYVYVRVCMRMCVFVYRCTCLCVVCMRECECVGDLRVHSVVCEYEHASLRGGVYPRVMFLFVCVVCM